MTQPLFVVVSGLPGSGKTTLGASIAAELGIGFICRDTIKEALHDVFPATDLATSMQLGAAAFEVLWSLLPSLTSSVLEAYWPVAEPWRSRAQRMLSSLPGSAVKVVCDCPKDLCSERFVARAKTARHASHGEHFAGYPLEPAAIADRWPDVASVGLQNQLTVDTTRPVDVVALGAEVRAIASAP